ncbi:hypothetical protein [Sulfitobacter sp.]|uniref:hypothetical protein n=1 Tax=Sulfitobacter sp. TaxID=1903071 RepID=UPI004059F231
MISRLISKRAIALTKRRHPDFVIGSPDDPYMLRWFWIPRNRFFNVYVHSVLRDDDDRALHDHPWASLSLMIESGLIEEYKNNSGEKHLRAIEPMQWVYRDAKFAHRLMVRDAPALTVFMTGPRVRQWGFLCPQGWRHWKDFVGADNPGDVGRGCGEMN